MKSIANQYKDLKEGRMSQANFMRNLRMSLPQYVTNVTSFNDAVKILKNKSILNESAINEDPIGQQAAGNPDEEAELRVSQIKKPSREEKIADLEAEIRYLEDTGNRMDPEITSDTIDILRQEIDKLKGKISEVKNTKFDKSAKPKYPNWTNASGKDYQKFVSDDSKVNLQSLTTGINIEHEENPEKSYEEIVKLVIKNLKKDPIYYTYYKLTGIRDYKPMKLDTTNTPEVMAMKVVTKDNLVDKGRNVKVVKLDKLKESQSYEHNEAVDSAQRFIDSAQRFIDSNPTLRKISDKIRLQLNGDDAVLQYGYWEQLPPEYIDKLRLQFDVQEDTEFDEDTGDTFFYILTPNDVEAEKYRAFQTKLQEIIREVIDEMYDGGSKDLAAMARSSNALRHKPETQAIAKKAAENANNKEEAASLAVKLAKAKGITDSEQITHIVDLATSKFMNETFDGRDDMNAQYAEDEITENNGSQEIEKKINTGEIDPAEVKAAAEKAMKGDSTDLALLMAFGK